MSAARKRVLIVEDNWVIARDYEALLIEAGFDVTDSAASCGEAIAACAKTRPDIVLMDVHLMGSEDGIDCALHLYQRWQVRSIFITAFNRPHVRERAEAAHALGWVTKPISKASLVQIVQSALENIATVSDRV